MAAMERDVLADLEARGLIAQTTGEAALREHLAAGPAGVYCGFDPTADSLHLGHLVPLLVLRRFQQAGHRPIALVGGATGLIGDPSFKAQERRLNEPDVIEGWVERLRAQVSRFLEFDGPAAACVVNNLDWMAPMPVLDFLRNIGKHFSVNAMIHKESVKQRLQREGEGISFTEFSYMLLQSYDFAELNRRHGCTIQVGGSDQWGNITGGIDLARRLNGAQTYGVTVPLITKADGTKFGKTESGAVWLDPAKTSPYAFYQFWLGTADADVYRFLRFFTFLDCAEIDAIEAADRAAAGRPQAQQILAREVTRLVHGEEQLQAAERITAALFSGDTAALSAADFDQLCQDGLPASSVTRASLAELTLTQLLADAGLASGKQVKDALGSGAVVVNGAALSAADNTRLADVFAAERARYGRYYLVRVGKKKYHLFAVGN